MALSSSEDPMIVAGVVLTQCQRVTDGQTDGFTIAVTALSIASYADALYKWKCCCICSVGSSPICRICHDTSASEALLSPCKCRGTVGVVHRSCIERWLSTANSTTCEICGFRYRTVHRERGFRRSFREVCNDDDDDIATMPDINAAFYLHLYYLFHCYSIAWDRL